MLRQRSRPARLLAILAAMVLVGHGSAAYADNVQNDVTASGEVVAGTVGVPVMVSYRITANNGDGENGCNATDASPATVSVVTPPGVTASPPSVAFTTAARSSR